VLPKITIVSASVGAGHDGAARELARRLTGRGFEVTVLDFLDLLPGRLGPMLRHTYATELAVAPASWGWLLRGLAHHRTAKTVARVAVRAAGRATLAALGPAPAVVVSTYPVASQVLGQLRRDGSLTAPVVTFLTDLSVHPLWVAEGVDLHLAIHDVAARQASRHGARVRVAGPAVGPAFHPDPPGLTADGGMTTEHREVRLRYGVPTDRPAALVVAGSWGVGEIEDTMRDIAASGVAVPVALCGQNVRLRQRLLRAGYGPALGWVDEPAPLIRACDVVVQNAGGLTSLEALACGRPVVSYRCVAGHGTTNAEALDEAGYAVWARDSRELEQALAEAVRPSARSVPGQRDHRSTPRHTVSSRFSALDDPARHIAELARVPIATVRAPAARPRSVRPVGAAS
jgi:UDP-N-acetylglucosamine:LPS N-acetylglucosamine transferase